MFNEAILTSPFTTSAADCYYYSKGFPNAKFCNDVSMSATLRALLTKRSEPEIKELYFYNTITLTVFGKGVTFINSDEYYKTGYMPRGYKELVDLELFAKQKKFDLRFLINESTKTSMVIGKKSLKCWHFIQSLIPRILPWYFSDEPITNVEKELLESLLLDSPLKYSACLVNMANGIDFYSQYLKSMLSDFDTSYERCVLKDIDDGIGHINGDITRLESELARKFLEKRELEIRKAGLMTGKFRGSGILDFFAENKNSIELTFAKDTILSFLVKTYLATYDQDYFESSINNHKSVFYEVAGKPHKGFAQEEIELLFRAIFSEQTLKIRTCGSFSFDFSNCHNGQFAVAHDDYPPEYSTYLPNQHLDLYACLGTYRSIITSAILKFEYVEAIQACIAATTCINMSESSTVLKFVEKILQENTRVIELPCGSVVTAREAIEFLKRERGLDGYKH